MKLFKKIKVAPEFLRQCIHDTHNTGFPDCQPTDLERPVRVLIYLLSATQNSPVIDLLTSNADSTIRGHG